MTAARLNISRLQHGSISKALAGLFLLTAAAAMVKPAEAYDPDLQPDSRFGPEDVVRIVVDALQNNKATVDDAGIATVYRFASPGNKASTGPLPRFTRMIKRGFGDMLSHTSARFDAMEVSGDTAVQAVWLLQPDGEEVGYAFQVGKQKSGPFENVWMTEAVVPLGESKQSGTRI